MVSGRRKSYSLRFDWAGARQTAYSREIARVLSLCPVAIMSVSCRGTFFEATMIYHGMAFEHYQLVRYGSI